MCLNVCVRVFSSLLIFYPFLFFLFGFLLHNNNIICARGHKRNVCVCVCVSVCIRLHTHTYCVMCCMEWNALGRELFSVCALYIFLLSEHCLGFLFDCFTYSFRWGAIPNRIWIIDLISDCSAFDTTRWFGFWRRVQIEEISTLDFFSVFAMSIDTSTEHRHRWC